MTKWILILVFGILPSVMLTAQEVSNVWFEQVGNNIQIYYSLEGNGNYTVDVFCKTDEDTNWGDALIEVMGDVGHGMVAGKDKVIVWNVLRETSVLEGNIFFKIIAKSDYFIDNTNYSKTSGTFIDQRDGQEYKWVRIGNQMWMAENLNYKKRKSWCYNNKVANCNEYGRLYNWETAIKACPNGWHIPIDAEWDNLVDYLRGSDVAGGKMKETGTTHWDSPNKDATNESGFTALPGGFRSTVGYFNDLGSNNSWWSATEYSSSLTAAWTRSLYYNKIHVERKANNKKYGFSVRCLRD